MKGEHYLNSSHLRVHANLEFTSSVPVVLTFPTTVQSMKIGLKVKMLCKQDGKGNF